MSILDDLLSQGDAAPAQATPVSSGATEAPQKKSVLDDLLAAEPGAAAVSGPETEATGVLGQASDALKSVPHGALSGFMGALSNAGQAGIAETPYLGLPGQITEEQAKTMTPEAMTKVAGGEDMHKPQTGFGKFVHGATEVGAQIATDPASWIGPGGLGRKVVTNAAAAIGNEAGGELGENIDAQGPGRFVGTLTGALLARGKKSPAVPVPLPSEAKEAANFGYKNARSMGIVIDQNSVDNYLVGRVVRDLRPMGIDADQAPKTFRELEKISSTNNNPRFLATISELDNARQRLGNVARDSVTAHGSMTTDGKAAVTAIRQMDNYLANLGQADLLAGHADLPQLMPSLVEARGNYAGFIRGQILEGALLKAARQAGSSGSGSNINNATRQQIKSIVNNLKKSRSFSPDDIDAMDEIIQGTIKQNTLRFIGKWAPTGVVSGGLSGLLGWKIAGLKGLESVMGLGTISKALADRQTQALVGSLQEQSMMRTPLYQQRMQAAAASGKTTTPPSWLPYLYMGATKGSS